MKVGNVWNVIDGLFRQCLDAKLSFTDTYCLHTVQSAAWPCASELGSRQWRLVIGTLATESRMPVLYHLRELVIK